MEEGVRETAYIILDLDYVNMIYCYMIPRASPFAEQIHMHSIVELNIY